ncbi:MAG: hypothetical protein HS128_21330 [Ideonella sp.]|nr:hypothetical protein [Ideonella sp.]MCC7457366.1 hypothetical protein [Nitrospira sp.]
MNPTRSAAAAVALALLCAGAAYADGPSANLSLVSKYKFRGQDQADPTKDMVPALQGGFDYTLGGFYVGNWNSAVGFGHGTEMDFYGGYRGKLSMLDVDAGVLQYYYPGSGAHGLNVTELYGQLGWQFITARYSLTVSDDYFGFVGGRNTGYLDVSANYELAKGLTLNAHVGQTFFSGDAKGDPANRILLNGSGPVNYTDYKLGVTYDVGNGFALAGAAIGANKRGVWGDANKARLVIALSKSL